jgi:CSLREA domain-containing protein
MATRQAARQAARPRSRRAHANQHKPLYRRPLRYEPLEDRRLLALVTVDTPLDTIDLEDGLTSLREAIFATNLVSGRDEITFDFGHDGPETIVLTKGELRITGDLTINGPGAELLTIDATGNDPTPGENSGDGSRVFNVDNGDSALFINVTIRGLTLTGGDVLAGGGAIRSREHFTLRDSIVSGSAAVSADPLILSYGGGIAHSDGLLAITGSIITENFGDFGGGIHVDGGQAFLASTSITANVGQSGAGIYNDGGVAFISRSTIRDNSAGAFSLGGGIYSSGHLLVFDTTISGNSADYGGGVFSRTETVGDNETLIVNSTISGNTAFSRGGGVRNAYGRTTIQFSTITGNTAPPGEGSGVASRGYTSATTRVSHTIIAGNTNSDVDFGTGTVNTFVSRCYNLIGTGNAAAAFQGPGDQTGVANPLLGPLADNGGFTLPDGSRILTHALLPGSPAINRGDLNAKAGMGGVPTYDQRLEPFSRVVNGRIDVGAFEYQEPSDLNLVVDTLDDESDGDYGRGDLSLREAIELANLYPSDDTIRFDPTLFTNGEATILLTLGHLHVKGNAAIEGPGAELLTIDASGNDPTPGVNNGDGSRVFTIEPAPPLGSFHSSLAGMTITGGDVEGTGGGIRTFTDLTLRDVAITNNSAFSNAGGGGISVRDRRLTVISSRITGNSAMGRNDYGGGILGINASISIVGSQISENMARYGGGVAVLLSHMLSIENSTVENNESIRDGGGIFSRGPVTINASVIRNNCGENGGGLYVQPGGSTSSNSEISNSSIIGNQATRDGGGAYLVTVNLLNTTFSSNVAGAAGGGLYALNLPTMGTHAFIKESRFIENRAGTSGGAIRSSANLRIIDSTISGNTADAHGGGIAVYHFNNNDGVLTENTTITGNGANQNGGGVFIQAPNDITVALTFSTITSNFSNFDSVAGGAGGGIFVARGRARLDHTIVAANRDRSSIAPDITGFIGTVLEPRFSLIGTNVGSGLASTPIDRPDENGNLIGGSTPINPRLGLLADNGGQTRTNALLPDSPALNAGDPAARAGVDGVPLFDQRGSPFTRVHSGRIDIGAYESQPNPLPGDYNFNGVVDAADVIVWRKTAFGTNDQRADGNGDGFVNQDDWHVWRANFGRTAESGEQGAESVEPAASDAPRRRAVWQPPVNDPPWRGSPGVSVVTPWRAFRPPTQRFTPQDDLLAALASPRATSHERNQVVPERRQSLRDADSDFANGSIDAIDRVFETVGWAPPTLNRQL